MSEDEYVKDEHQRGRPRTRTGKRRIHSYVYPQLYDKIKIEAEMRGLSITRVTEELLTERFLPLSIIDMLSLPTEVRKATEEQAKQDGGYYRLVENAITRYVQKTKKDKGKGRKGNYETFKKMTLYVVEVEERELHKKLWKTELELMRILRQCGCLDRRTLRNYLAKMADEGLAAQKSASWIFKTDYDPKKDDKTLLAQPDQNHKTCPYLKDETCTMTSCDCSIDTYQIYWLCEVYRKLEKKS